MPEQVPQPPNCHLTPLVIARKGELYKEGRMLQELNGTNPLTSLCSMQILQSHTGCGRLLEVSTPHLVQTFWGQNIAQCTLRYARLGAAGDQEKWLGMVAMKPYSPLVDIKR